MTTYLGLPNSPMIPVAGAVTEEVKPEERVSEEINLAGRRTLWVDPPGVPSLRSWSLEVGQRDPTAVSTLAELGSLRTTLRMVTDYAAWENVLTPVASIGGAGWINGVTGGPVQVEALRMPRCDEGVSQIAATSIQSDQGNLISPFFPVIPGVPVTACANVRARPGMTGTFRLDWMELGVPPGSGPKQIADMSSLTDTAAPLPLLTVGAVPPPDVHIGRLSFINVSQVARPSATWTQEAQPWRLGAGADSVYIHLPSKGGVIASPGLVISSYGYTVTEVSS